MSEAVYTKEDVKVYEQLRHEMETTSHGGLFSVREFEDDPLGLLRLQNAYVEPKPFDPQRFEQIKETILFPGIITEPSYKQLVDGMEEMLDTGKVQDHISPKVGGSLVWASGHISYADIAVMTAARTEVNIRQKRAAPNATHVAIASRLVSLFALDGLARDGGKGYVVDDGLLEFCAYLQTVPSSASGTRLRSFMGVDANGLVWTNYLRLLNRGVEFFVAPSGTQDKVSEDGKSLVMDTVSKGTVRMLTEPNEERGAERLLAVPVFVDCNPFAGGSWNGAVDATHRFLEPRFLYETADVTEMMEGIATAGVVYKRSGTLPPLYRRPTLATRLGEVGSRGAIHKD